MADGVYQRLNGPMMASAMPGTLAAVVGKVLTGGSIEQVQFRASDEQAVIAMDTSQMDAPLHDTDPEMVVEIVGQVTGEQTMMAFVCRPLGIGTNLQVYDKMIQLQADPAYAEYFGRQGMQA